ncbi:MAG TPA: Gfo/Idh/MocA family oxidoreductase [Bryobacteraceae bacterium]|nr:Gfo/Idh/MocA family oxidoreductase [Bryobacteraceae bacterium]
MQQNAGVGVLPGMSIAEKLGLGSDRKVRYGIVGLGDISQEALMPGVKHTGNSEITALVTGDREKARALAERYQVGNIYGYDEFAKFLGSGVADAIYLATPNWRHAEFAIPALKAGVHVLLEKPMEIDSEKCREIINAQRASKAKLMIAYRLHFEPATLALIDLVRSGKLGKLRFFTSSFAQNVKPENHRAQNGPDAGPVFDMGPYPINAARNLFEAEPVEVSAFGTRHGDAQLGDFDHTVAVTMRFPEERLAQFVVSYAGNSIDSYTVVGSEGSATVSPGFIYGKSLEYELTVGEDKKTESFKNTDQFGGELKYFSECVLNDRDPEPDGEEGLMDVRVIEAILRALETGTAQKLEPVRRSKRIDTAQVEKLGAVKPPEPVNAESPAR